MEREEEPLPYPDRSEARLRSILGAKVIFANGNSSMDCLIRDFSATGARLDLSSNVAIPDRFDLFVIQKNQTFRAVIKWRRANEVGVEFEPEHQAVAPPAKEAKLSDRVSELEAEIVSLKRSLAEMRGEFLGRTRSDAGF